MDVFSAARASERKKMAEAMTANMQVVQLKGPCTPIFVRVPISEHRRLDRLRALIEDEMKKEFEEGKAAVARGFGPAAPGGSADAPMATGDPQEAQLAAIVQRVTASVAASVNEIVATHLLPLRAEVKAQGQMLADVSTASRATRVLACKAYNAQCGEGGALPYMPVPNAAHEDAPTGEAPLTNRADLLALTAERAAAWCKHYDISAPPALDDRRRAVAKQLRGRLICARLNSDHSICA